MKGKEITKEIAELLQNATEAQKILIKGILMGANVQQDLKAEKKTG